jgi:hypothetical protein
VEVEDRLFEPACEDVSGKTDDLLGSDESMYPVIY